MPPECQSQQHHAISAVSTTTAKKHTDLCLHIIACDNVAHSAQRWHQHSWGLVPAPHTNTHNTMTVSGDASHTSHHTTLLHLPHSCAFHTQTWHTQLCSMQSQAHLLRHGDRQNLSANGTTCLLNTCVGCACQRQLHPSLAQHKPMLTCSRCMPNTTRYAVKHPNSHQQLHKAPADAGLDDLVDTVVVTIRQVAQRPACVCQHLLVVLVDQAGQGGQGLLGLQATWHNTQIYS